MPTQDYLLFIQVCHMLIVWQLSDSSVGCSEMPLVRPEISVTQSKTDVRAQIADELLACCKSKNSNYFMAVFETNWHRVSQRVAVARELIFTPC
jgi:hypothetical protein